MKAKIIAFIVSKSGSILKVPVTAGVGFLANWLVSIGYTLSLEEQTAIVTGVTGILIAAIDTFVNKSMTDGVKKIQEVEGIKQDGVPGAVTVKSVETTNKSLDKAQKLLRNGGRGV